MRAWASVGVVVAALVAAGATVGADNPPGVYNDYAKDGVLSCGYSRAALRGVLNDASIQQYSDPLRLLGLKLAVRKQLAGGCRREERAALPLGSAAPGGAPPPAKPPANPGSTRTPSGRPKQEPPSPGTDPAPVVADVTGDARDGWMVLLGIALLLVTLGSGGWAARRAFSEQP